MFAKKRFISLLLSAVMLLSLLPVTPVGASGTAVTSCVIDSAEDNTVVVQLQVEGGITTEDGQLYLFAVPTYVDSITDQTPVAAVAYTGAGAINSGYR